MVLSPLCVLGMFVKDQLTISEWMYFCAVDSVSFVSRSVFMAEPCCFACYSFGVYFKSGSVMTSFVLFAQHCFGYSVFFLVNTLNSLIYPSKPHPQMYLSLSHMCTSTHVHMYTHIHTH